MWDQWPRQIEPSAPRAPWMPTVGNRRWSGNGELGYAGYLDRLSSRPRGSRRAVTYSFVYGNVGFVARCERQRRVVRGSPNLDRLAQDRWALASGVGHCRPCDAGGPTSTFVVVGFHRTAMYCTNLVHGSDGGNRSRWEPIFDRCTASTWSSRAQPLLRLVANCSWRGRSATGVVAGGGVRIERAHPMRVGVALRHVDASVAALVGDERTDTRAPHVSHRARRASCAVGHRGGGAHPCRTSVSRCGVAGGRVL